MTVWTVFGSIFQISVKISEPLQNYNPLIYNTLIICPRLSYLYPDFEKTL